MILVHLVNLVNLKRGNRSPCVSDSDQRHGCTLPFTWPRRFGPVSYTHLDVYKRQPLWQAFFGTRPPSGNLSLENSSPHLG